MDEIVAVMRCAGDTQHGLRTRPLIVLLWRAGLRISEALSLAESDLDAVRGSVLVRQGKGGKRSEVGMDRWAWQHLTPWLELPLPVGALICVLSGSTRSALVCRSRTRSLRRLAVRAGVRRRFAPHQLRHAHAVEMAREGVPLNVIQRLLGHANLGITSVYLKGINNSEIIETVHARPAPMLPASAGLRYPQSREALAGQLCGWPMLTIQAMPNWSKHIPNSSPHICFSSGTDTVPSVDSFSQ